jgi:hypothetical protein
MTLADALTHITQQQQQTSTGNGNMDAIAALSALQQVIKMASLKGGGGGGGGKRGGKTRKKSRKKKKKKKPLTYRKMGKITSTVQLFRNLPQSHAYSSPTVTKFGGKKENIGRGGKGGGGGKRSRSQSVGRKRRKSRVSSSRSHVIHDNSRLPSEAHVQQKAHQLMRSLSTSIIAQHSQANPHSHPHSQQHPYPQQQQQQQQRRTSSDNSSLSFRDVTIPVHAADPLQPQHPMANNLALNAPSWLSTRDSGSTPLSSFSQPAPSPQTITYSSPSSSSPSSSSSSISQQQLQHTPTRNTTAADAHTPNGVSSSSSSSEHNNETGGGIFLTAVDEDYNVTDFDSPSSSSLNGAVKTHAMSSSSPVKPVYANGISA